MKIGAASLLFFLPLFIYAQEDDLLPGAPTGAEFLNVNTDIKSSGMGNLRSVPVTDAHALFSNPARIAFPLQSNMLNDVGITYSPLASSLSKDIKLLSLSTTHYIGGGNMNGNYIGFSVQYLTYGDVYFRDESGNESDYYRPREYSIGASYIKRFGEFFSMGLTAKGIFSQLMGRDVYGDIGRARAFAVDFGIYSEIPSGDNFVHLGLSLQNIGTKLMYEGGNNTTFLPQVLRIGSGYRIEIDRDYSYFFIGAEWNKPLVPYSYDPDVDVGVNVIDAFARSLGEFSGSGFSLGAEAGFAEQFYARAGYSMEPEQFNRANLLSFGLGAHAYFGNNRISIDGAFQLPTGSKSIGMRSMFKIGISYQLFE